MSRFVAASKDACGTARFVARTVLISSLLALTPGRVPALAQNPSVVETRGNSKHAAILAPSPAPAEPVAEPVMWEVGPAGPEARYQSVSPIMGDRPRGPLSTQSDGPEPTGWYSGDMHVHRSCGGSPVPVSTIYDAMVAQDIAVISLLADMGNGEAQNPVTDLPLVTGEDDPISTPGRIIHWDAEWHWDPVYTQYPHLALGGHLNNLGLKEAHQIWDEYTHPIIDWAHQQGGISGFVHMQYLGAGVPQTLSCCIPIEYPVEVALGAADYIAEDVAGGEGAIEAYYRLLNCGLRPGFAAGTDYPCGQIIGPLVTFAQVPGTLTYRGWIDAIARGRTVVSRVGTGQFLDLQVNGAATPGDEIQLTVAGDVQVSAQWSADQSASGTIELVHNGVVVASKAATAAPGATDLLTATVTVPQSGWICARVMGGSGHVLHTAAVFVTVAGAPVRASVSDAEFYVDWIDQLIAKTSPGGVWNSYFQEDLAAAQARYQAARTIYQQVAAGSDVAPFVVWRLPVSSGTDVPLAAPITAKFNEALDPATVTASTFLLKDASQNPVAASVTYDAGLRTAALTPSAPLAYSTTYTATLIAGSGGIRSAAGTALGADESWSFTTAAQDLTPPTVTTHVPASGATSVALSTTVTATFSEALDPATVSTSTFELRDAADALVSATVTLSALGQVATLTPAAALAFATTYTATLKSGTGGIEDLAGNPLASDVTWSFTTDEPPPPPPDEGPGGPILVIGSAANPFTRYYAEILRNEGLNAFMVRDISQVDATYLSAYDVAILGEMPLDAGQVQMLTDWVTAGGNLIATRPDKQLAGLLGLSDAGDTLSNKYLLVDTATGPGVGIVNQTIQFHGKADLYTLNGATPLATFYADASTATPYPAVTMRNVGTSGGVAVAFTYDLARSVVYTRQGNPAWAGQERDGNIPIRAHDYFWGNAAGDPQPNWIDLNKAAIPQADEQQRLLANIVLKTNLDRKPLPRFWYFPRGKKAVVIMTGDNHGDAGMRPRFDTYMQQSDADCSVDDWECIRATGYLFLAGGFPDSAAARYDSYGFETALHVNTGCADFTPASLEQDYTNQLATFTATYPSIPIPESNRTHCVVWSDWVTSAEVEVAHGTRLDTNYYYWFVGGVGSWPGMHTGSGMPMRFARLDGSMVDCYQATTQMTDESGQSYPYTIDALLDKAMGPEGYYGAFTANMHFDSAPHSGSDAIVASAKARGVPVVSALQMLRWLDGRNASKFEALAWDGTLHQLSFTITPGTGARNLEAMLPIQGGIGDLTGITLAGVPVTYRTETIKGIQYGIFPAAPGNYVAQYLEDTVPPLIGSVVATAVDDGIATVTWTTNEPATSRVDYGTAPNALTLNVQAATMVTSHGLTLTGLAANQTYYYRVSSTDDASLTTTYPETGQQPDSFTMPPLTCLKDDTEAQFALGTPGTGTVVSPIGNGAVTLATTAGSEFNGTGLDPGWETILPAALPGTATVGGGVVQLNGALIRTTGAYPVGRSVEFVATFSGATNEHVGLGVDLNLTDWAIFSTYGGGALYARTSAATTVDTPIPGSWFNAPHRYRIDWNPGSVVFWIDGNQVATTTNSPSQDMRPVASDLANDATAVTVDWMRMTPYAGSGSFLSRVYGGVDPVTWGPATWAAQTPAGTGLMINVRRGDTDTPDGTWTAFQPVAASGDIVGGRTRYIQYRADLTTSDGQTTPVLEEMHIACTAELDETPPVISAVVATPASSAATIAWTTNEVANSRVDYGTSPDTLAQHVSGGAFTLAHSLQLTGLAPLTQYHYRVTSVDPSDNPAVEPPSGNPLSFTTTAHTTPPVISDVAATPAPSGTAATVAWTTDETATSAVLYGTDAENLNLTAEVAGLVTSHSVPLTGLTAGITYYYRVRSVDAYGLEATLPVAPTAPLSFVTPAAPCPADVAAADFALGSPGADIYVSPLGDGEVVLRPAEVAEFSGSALPDGWTVTTWTGGGSATVSGDGLLTVAGAMAESPTACNPGTSVEFVATFGAETYQHVGWESGGGAFARYVMFSTSGSTNTVYARANDGGVSVGGSELIGTPHRYRIVWNANNIEYYVDEVLVVTRSVAVAGPMHPMASDAATASPSLPVDWMRVGPYPSASSFTSRIFDGAVPTDWGVVTWNGGTPAGTGLSVSVRTSTTSPPDAGWTPFAPVANGASVGENARYLQYRATLTTGDGTATPSLADITIACAAGPDLTSPVISNVLAAPAPGGASATITWDTGKFANSRVDYGTNPLALSQNAVSVSLARSHSVPLTGLTPGFTYYYRVTSEDRAGHVATDPPSPATYSFTTSMVACFVDQDSTSFASGILTDAAVSIDTDGEVILAPTLANEFSGTSLPIDWTSVSWGGPGSTVSDGHVTVDGGRLTPTSLSPYGSGRALEFAATFTGVGQHLGFGAGDNSTGGSSMFNVGPWAIFSTGLQSASLYARVTGNADVNLGTSYLGGTNYIGYPHRYRIEWRADSVIFLVDGRSVSRQGASPSAGMRPGFSDGTDTATIQLDWVRVTPYAASGAFTSRVYDAGTVSSWGTMSWTASLPTGASLAMFVRGGDASDTTDASWTPWNPIGSTGGGVGICSRYVQYRAVLGTTDADATPALRDVAITCGPTGSLAAVTGLACTPATSGNDASGRTRIRLDWSGGGGGVQVYRKGYGDHPTYRDGVGAVPVAPANPAAAQADGWTLTDVTASGQFDQPPARDLWYYVAFDTDMCGNASPVSNLAGGALDYVLGDVTDGTTPCAGDNVVTVADVSLLGWHYGGLTSQPEVPACLDVGPTVGGSPQGRPLPDGVVEFEDLVIYALNYNSPPPGPGALAGRKATPASTAAAANALALVVPDLPAVGETFSVIVRAAGAGDVRALSLTLGYDRSVVEMLKPEAAELLNRQESPAVVLSPGPGRVDVALLGQGAGLSGEGELVRVEFRLTSAGRPGLVLARANARDGANRPVAMDGMPRPQPPALPMVTRLAPARPNPFLQALTIAYSLDHGGPIDLAVYAVDGRRVRTIVRDLRGPGEYEETWDGRDDGGRATAAGVYYVRLVTDQSRFVRRVTYLR